MRRVVVHGLAGEIGGSLVARMKRSTFFWTRFMLRFNPMGFFGPWCTRLAAVAVVGEGGGGSGGGGGGGGGVFLSMQLLC